MIKAVLFDLDGTLIDTNELIIESYKHTFKTHLNLEESRENIVKTFGEPLKATMERYSLEKADDMVDTYRNFNEAIHDERVSAFKGVVDGLNILKSMNIKIGIVTSKRRSLAERGLAITDILSYMDVIVTPEDTQKHKPEGEPVLKACELLGVSSKEALMVGDSHNDILSGKNAGAKTCLVSYTALPIEGLKSLNPNYIIDSVEEIKDIILKKF